MLKKTLPLLFLLFLLNSCKETTDFPTNFTQYVNPFIGTGGHGHTYPGAAVPFGMMQLSPDTRLTGWDGCSAYHYSDSVVYGFSHTHLSGTGISDYGDILFMPTVGEAKLQKGSPENRSEGYCSLFSHEKETAEAGFYKTFLEDYGIAVELTATERAGLHKYIFPEADKANIILDLEHRDIVLDSYLKVVSDTEIEGFRRSKAWAQDQSVFFVAQFSKPFNSYSLALNDTIQSDVNELNGKNIKAHFNYKTTEGEEILIRIGISGVDIEGARKNLEAEIQDWNFENIKTQAKDKWNKELSKIEVKSSKESDKRVFYTALYHSFLNPNLSTDVDGRYRGTDLKIHTAKDFTNYTVFSLWDTYRAAHPLYTLVQQERTNDFVKTFLAQYENGGILPMWEFAGNYTQCMIGYHAVPVIVDAYIKGITDFDAEKALEAMKFSAEHTQLGLEAYQKYGFIPLDKEHESVSKTLEYAYDDWTIAQMAKAMDDEKTYKEYIQRAQYYKNIFDKETGFMRPKMNGSWQSPFNPREVNFNYTEANSWQYSFYVPQDVSGLVTLLGGDEAFSQKLDELFTAESETTGRHQVDITGLIGQYAHGNEPSHHMAYLYNYVGKPWKAQKVIRQIFTEMYSDAPDGLSGNEDCGQMSAWHVLSAMGFYSVTPGSDIYVIGTPLFDEVKLNAGEKPFVIKANNLSKENFYIQSVTLNGKAYSKSFIRHKTIMEGGELVFEMANKPNKDWASAAADRPISTIADDLLLPVPYFKVKGRTFYDTLRIEMAANTPETQIFYTLDNSQPTEESLLYSESFSINKSMKIKAIAIDKAGNRSFVIDAEYFKIPKNRTVEIKSTYSKQYSAGGDNGLIDFIRGGDDFRNGSWQGYQAQDFEAIVDLGKSEKISKVAGCFLQEIRPWIWMPTSVEYWSSNDGKNFKKLGTVENTILANDYALYVKEFILKVSTKARYIKVIAHNYGTIPDWHLGAGNQAYIFVDEIIIE